DGSVVASGSGNYPTGKCTLEIWDARTAKPIHSLSPDGRKITGIAFSPDGKRLVSTSGEGVAHVWDVQTGKALFALGGHTTKRSFLPLAYSRDGKLIATADDNTVRLWDAATGKTQRVLEDTNQVTCLAFSPDSTRLAGGRSEGDRDVCVWEVAT